ncbi:MAG: amidohydrolase family protein [Pseudomonadota bacterium]
MAASQPCDLVIEARWVVPARPTGLVLDNHAIVIADGRVIEVAPIEVARALWRPTERVERRRHLVLPGFINARTQAATTLFRGLADDLRTGDPQRRRLGSLEQRWVSADMVRDGTRLAVAEMLAGGTTCFADAYWFPDACAEAAADFGMRCVVGLPFTERPPRWSSATEGYLGRAIDVHDQWASDPLISTRFVIDDVNDCSDAGLRRLRTLADELDLRLHVPFMDTREQLAESERRHGAAPLARLESAGIVNANLSLAHAIQLSCDDLRRITTAGAAVVHCPQSNAKLAAGIAPIRDLRDAGIAVALGTDGAASNNDLDMLSEMHTAAMLARLREADPLALTAHECINMATLGGARCLGLERDIGSIEPGKLADLVAIAFDEPACWPVHDPVSQLVFAATRCAVADTWIAGQNRFTQGTYSRLDLNAVHSRTEEWRERLC